MDCNILSNLDSRLLIIGDEANIDNRSPYLHDRDRILFSRSLRRLAAKTQVVSVSGKETNDHLRSRLTHSLEVMQIASSIGKEVNRKLEEKSNLGNEARKLDIDLVEAISLAHDIGHTPYGHVGERMLCNFLKSDVEKKKQKLFPDEKLKHSFQSLKVCCFLEKQYLPDFCGLNLTLATLDGVLKHSKIDEGQREFYKKCFESYYENFILSFLDDNKSNVMDNKGAYEAMKKSFDYVSPITLEGAIVSIADEIAQLSHDMEDYRRLSSSYEVLHFYKKVDGIVNQLVIAQPDKSKLSSIYTEYSECLREYENDNFQMLKLERLYTKLILHLAIPFTTNLILALWEIDNVKLLTYFKEYHIGSFEDILEMVKDPELKSDLDLNSDDLNIIKCLNSIFAKHNAIPKKLNIVARWDLKGEYMCKNLSEILYSYISSGKKDDLEDLKLEIFENNLIDHMRLSYSSGCKLSKNLGFGDPKIRKDMGIKCLIWDYMAGMTDNFIIKEYESLSFNRAELR